MTNYFELLELEDNFNVDLNKLEKNYLKLQANFLSDHSSIDLAEAVNKAYRTIKNPIERASYILETQGFDLNHSQIPEEFLDVIMEIHECMDADEDIKQSEAINQLNIRYQDAFLIMESAFNEHDYDKAYKSLLAVKYIGKIKQKYNTVEAGR